jgi:hypothetical protein
MAAPAIALAVKAAIAAATDKRTWKAAGILIAAILTPVILAIVMILSLLSGTSQHNNAAVDLCFNGGAFSSSAPAEYTAHIEDMRNCFSALDQAISGVDAKMDGGTLDSVQIKSIFYALNFGADHLSLSGAEAKSFVDCFVRYEERTKTVKDEATGEEKPETETVAVPVSLNTAYANLSTSGISAKWRRQNQRAEDLRKGRLRRGRIVQRRDRARRRKRNRAGRSHPAPPGNQKQPGPGHLREERL